MSLSGVWLAALSIAKGPYSPDSVLFQRSPILLSALLTVCWKQPLAVLFGNSLAMVFWTVVPQWNTRLFMEEWAFFKKKIISFQKFLNYFVTAWLNLVINAVIKSLPFPKLMFLFCVLICDSFTLVDDKTRVGFFTTTYIMFLNNVLWATQILFLNYIGISFFKYCLLCWSNSLV